MLRVINILSIIRLLAITTTFISILTYEVLRKYWQNDIPIIKVLSIAPWVAAGLLLLLTTDISARLIWGSIRRVKKNLFPDLNGTWDGEIIVSESLQIPARAVIKQSLLQVQIEIHTETSKSITLETTPTVEFGQHRLYYLYKSIPKNPEWDEYKGTTTFDIRTVTEGTEKFLELSGAYFTSRLTIGRVRFRQISRNIDEDVSFY